MAIELNTTASATVVTSATQELQCDFGWVDSLVIDAKKRTLALTTVDATLIPAQSNDATTKIPTFSDADHAIPIVISNLAMAIENYPAQLGPVFAAIESAVQSLGTTVRTANLAKLATAQTALTVAQTDLKVKTAAVKTAQDAITAAASAGQTIDVSSPLVAALATARSDLAASQALCDTANQNVTAGQAALADLSNPPLS
jgi:hypothetical protein